MDLSAFAGDWTLTRRIEDHRAGAPGRFEGTARFQPAAGGLAYRETGLLTLGTSAPLRATRSYVWQAAVDAIAVRFADGRFFHAFATDAAEPRAEHDCPPDLYRVRYDFRDWPHWRVEWRVAGPRKDYAMLSDYHPAPATGGRLDRPDEL